MPTKNINLKLSLAAVLSASMLLTACQLGGPEAPSDKDMDNASKDQKAQVQSNTDGGQGGAVVSSDDGESGGEGDASVASTKTSFDDLWMLDSVTSSDDAEVWSGQDVLYYGTTYEMVCGMELYDDEDGKTFACALPGIDLVGTWEETGEHEATLSIPISDTETQTASLKMSDDCQTVSLAFDGDENGLTYNCHRDDDTTMTLSEMIDRMEDNNDKFFNALPVDSPQDVTIVDNDEISIKLLGTTHTEEGMTGYLLEALNKTDQTLIINDFIDTKGGSPFTVNGSQDIVPALTGRVLPPVITDEETGSLIGATMRCAILFSADDTGGAVTNCSGNLVVTDYHWNEVGRYPFAI